MVKKRQHGFLIHTIFSSDLFKFTTKQRKAVNRQLLFVSVFMCLKTCRNQKIETESRLHFIDIYNDDCTKSVL